MQISGTAGYSLAQKMKALKCLIKNWNNEVFGRLDMGKRECLRQIEEVDAKRSMVPFQMLRK